ncbi:MAG: type II secretion system F family protein [Pseudomonadales bacterium]|nr:type II secretion system F family protein [Pseudomonadales bacterium]
MAMFQYKGRDTTGGLVTGNIDAISAEEAASELVDRAITPIEIRQVKMSAKSKAANDRVVGKTEKTSSVDKINEFLAGRRVDVTELIIFARQMYSLTKAGLPLDRALTGLQASMRNRVFKSILKDIVVGLESGMNLSSALGRHPKVFSPLFLALVNVGENTGQLDLAFKEVGRYLELEKNTRKQIKSATRYPIFVMVAIVVALAVITYFVIPAFAQTFARLGAQLPLETRILIAVSDFVVAYWMYMLASVAAAVAAWRSWIGSAAGRLTWDRTKMHLPIVGPVFERIALGRFARTFAMVMRAGVPIVHGLGVVAGAVGNKFVGGRVLRMRDGISRGESLYNTAVQSNMFSPLVLQMIAVGEESGAIDELLAEVAEFYDSEVEYDLKKLGDAIEPILIMFIAGIVLVLALGVFLPIWDLNSAVR